MEALDHEERAVNQVLLVKLEHLVKLDSVERLDHRDLRVHGVSQVNEETKDHRDLRVPLDHVESQDPLDLLEHRDKLDLLANLDHAVNKDQEANLDSLEALVPQETGVNKAQPELRDLLDHKVPPDLVGSLVRTDRLVWDPLDLAENEDRTAAQELQDPEDSPDHKDLRAQVVHLVNEENLDLKGHREPEGRTDKLARLVRFGLTKLLT